MINAPNNNFLCHRPWKEISRGVGNRVVVESKLPMFVISLGGST